MASVSAGYSNFISLKESKAWKDVKNGYTKFINKDILIAKITPCFQNRKSAIANNLINGIGCGSSEFHVLRTNENIVDREYLLLFFKSPWFITYGVENFKGTAGQQRLGTSELKNCRLPLPSLSEQRRIVAKTEKLLEQINRAEKAYNELSGPLSERFRQLCLERAIQGKLVPQLESEPEVIGVKVSSVKVPFIIPEKWKWFLLGEVIDYGKIEQVRSSFASNDTWTLDLEDIEKNTGRILLKKRGVASTSNKNIFKKGWVLYSKLRPYLNKVVIADEDGFCTTEIVPIDTSKARIPLTADYLQAYLMSPHFLAYANQVAHGVKMPRIGTKDVKASMIPIPPLAEQKRIAQQLKKLFHNINELKKNK